MQITLNSLYYSSDNVYLNVQDRQIVYKFVHQSDPAMAVSDGNVTIISNGNTTKHLSQYIKRFPGTDVSHISPLGFFSKGDCTVRFGHLKHCFMECGPLLQIECHVWLWNHVAKTMLQYL